VYKAVRKPSSEEIAVKKVKTESFEDAQKEANIHYNLNHENVVIIYGIARDGPQTMIVMELMKLGNLLEYLVVRKPTEVIAGYFSSAKLELNDLLRISYQVGLHFHISRTRPYCFYKALNVKCFSCILLSRKLNEVANYLP
jgi:serine/threonine protein kinase